MLKTALTERGHMARHIGDTIFFEKQIVIKSYAAVGGKKESEGPLSAGFDALFKDNYLGKQTWEMAESALQHKAVELCLQKACCKPEDVSFAFAGDLQAQCTASNYAMRELGVPFLGLYGACSTMAESLGICAVFCESDCAKHTLAVTSSHFCTAEREFRTPLDYGGKRTPSAQWTATAAGAVLVGAKTAKTQTEVKQNQIIRAKTTQTENTILIKATTFGRVQDLEVCDINNMGAAMAPAAAATLCKYFADSQKTPSDFDAIFTGDLGAFGSALLIEVMEREGVILQNHKDCGCLLYSKEKQTVNAGGSGAGCSASVLASYILPKLKKGELRKVLFVATGALMSQTSFLQGESIPGIAHLIELESSVF